MDVVAVLAASPAAIALITGCISLVTLYLANRNADVTAARHAEEASARLRFEASEHRYEDRRDALIALDSVAEREVDAATDFEMKHAARPGDHYYDYSFKDLVAAHARVAMLSTPPVAEAAETLKGEVVNVFFGKDQEDWQRYRAALAAFRHASREMLNEPTA